MQGARFERRVGRVRLRLAPTRLIATPARGTDRGGRPGAAAVCICANAVTDSPSMLSCDKAFVGWAGGGQRTHVSALAIVDDLADQQVDARVLSFRRDTAATTQDRQAVKRGTGDFSPQVRMHVKELERWLCQTKFIAG